jgi:hypothetical protein
MMIVMVTMVKKNENDSSATTSDGLLPLTNPVIVHLEGEKKMVGNKEGEGEKKRKEKWEMMVRR